uniref:Uncharacterized protein n=1 Tax=Physcomitrium patens TaxID=3218 RepID=A0A2K1K6P2_PHYPA|nr:hypothetical protein PHYPA_011334 [Physcomitrium patens]
MSTMSHKISSSIPQNSTIQHLAPLRHLTSNTKLSSNLNNQHKRTQLSLHSFHQTMQIAQKTLRQIFTGPPPPN